MTNFLKKWFAFFRPVFGWRQRFLQFKSGSTTWDVPGHPNAPKVVPFPVQWIPHRITGAEDEAKALDLRLSLTEQQDILEQRHRALADVEASSANAVEVGAFEALVKNQQELVDKLKARTETQEGLVSRGFEFLASTCVDSGKDAPVGVGVLCLRCGLPLHPEAANMMGGFDPPFCKRCSWPLLLIGR